MKKILIIIVVLTNAIYGLAQCVQHISTNPKAPIADPNLFPGYQNPYLNSFDWAEIIGSDLSFADTIYY